MVNTLGVSSEKIEQLIDELSKAGLVSEFILEKKYNVNVEDFPYNFYGNLSNAQKNKSILFVFKDDLELLRDTRYPIFRPNNREQRFLANALYDPTIELLTVTGPAGTGKTYCVLAAAIDLVMNQKKYERIILTKPRTQVTDDADHEMGEVPGNILEKMAPQMISYMSSIRSILGGNTKDYLQTAIDKGQIEILPLEHLRGADLANAFIICDEAQNMGFKQYKMLTTRPGKNAKLVLMGDCSQQDKDTDGIVPMLHYSQNYAYLESPLTANIELVKVERSELVKLMIEVTKDEPRRGPIRPYPLS